jgi:DNA-binding transcriptional MocR family regulator
VQVRHQVWSIRCGHALGVLAVDFAADLQASELPPDLDEDARRLYFQELEPYVLAVQREALGYYEKTDRLARRLGFTGPWVERNQRALATLRKALESQPQ